MLDDGIKSRAVTNLLCFLREAIKARRDDGVLLDMDA